MLKTGIVSVTFRKCGTDEIISRAVKAKLNGIEWGSDVHVPVGEIELAKSVSEKCKNSGLKIYSYGSYYNGMDDEDFKPVLETGFALGAPNIRIWAGKKSSADITVEERSELIKRFQDAADAADVKNIKISFEYHCGTLTDNVDSALKLIYDIDRKNVNLYWQPNQYKDLEFNRESLIKVLPYLSNVHVFTWEGNNHLPLAEGLNDWNEYIRIIQRSNRSHGLFLEFVPNDSEESFYRDSETLNDLTNMDILHKIKSMKLDIPYSDDTSVLSEPIYIKGDNITLKNAITIHPMEGYDGNDDGSPSELSIRRYRRFASSGASLIWLEAVAVQEDARTSEHQLWIRECNLDSFKRLAELIHELSDGAPAIIQLTHSGRFANTPSPVISYYNPIMNEKLFLAKDYPLVTDDYLNRLEEQFLKAAELSEKAGFDGVDIKACHRYLLSELLSAYTREGKYGGSYENRTRLFKNIIKDIKDEFGSKLIVASRLGLYDAIDYPYGFGVDKDDYRKPDLTETLKLVDEIHQLGVNIIDVTMGTPYFNPHVNRPYSQGGYLPPENPLLGVERLIKYAGEVQKAQPDVTFIGTGYSYLNKYASNVAAGAINKGLISAVGFGRMAFAYEGLANDILAGKFDIKKSCTTCGKCTEIMRAHGTTGCPVRDSEIYAPIYRKYCLKKG